MINFKCVVSLRLHPTLADAMTQIGFGEMQKAKPGLPDRGKPGLA